MRLLNTEGAGKTGCALHPRSRVHDCAKKRTRAYRFSGGIRPSLRNGFTGYSVLSPATNSSCHRHRRIDGFARPGWISNTSANLTSATDARTTRLHRTRIAPLVLRAGCSLTNPMKSRPAISDCAPDAAASTASHRAFVTFSSRPSFGWDGAS